MPQIKLIVSIMAAITNEMIMPHLKLPNSCHKEYSMKGLVYVIDIRPHSLMLKQGVHPKIVQERLGHASITTTLDT